MSISFSRLKSDEESLLDEENILQEEKATEDYVTSIRDRNTRNPRKKIVSIILFLFVILSCVLTAVHIISVPPNSTREELNTTQCKLGQYFDKNGSHYEYPSYERITQAMNDIEICLANTKNVSIETIGHSVENNPIKLIQISPVGQLKDNKSHPLVWVVCGVHAREWTVPYTCLRFLFKLKDIFLSGEDNIFSLMRFNFVVVANPDGYTYSMSTENRRMTRKNRHRGFCSNPDHDGVDLNRNFGVGFDLSDCNDQGFPDNCNCLATYAGPSAFSEPESRAIRDAMSHDVPWLVLSVHGNAQAWTYPYAYKSIAAPLAHSDDMKNVVKNIKNKFGTIYNVGFTSGNMYGYMKKTGGTLSDWTYEHLNVRRTFIHELKSLHEDDKDGFDHFQPPLHEVNRDIVPEAWYGFKTLIDLSYKHDRANDY